MPYARDDAGNIFEVDAQGNPVRLHQAAPGRSAQQGGVYTLPQSPEQQAAAARAARAQEMEAERLRLAQAEGERKAREWAATHDPGGKPLPADVSSPKLTAETRQKAIQQFYATQDLQRNVVPDLRQKFKEGPGKTGGLTGFLDLLPTEANSRFNNSANRARGTVRNALGMTGGELNTAGEAQMNIGSYIPSTKTYDTTTLDTIDNLAQLGRDKQAAAIATLGGVPDQNGVVHPVGSPEANAILGQMQAAQAQQQDQDGGALPLMSSGSGSGPNGGNGDGGLSIDDYADRNTQSAGPVRSPSGFLVGPATRQEYDREVQKKAEAMFRAGASFEELNQFSIQSGYGGIDVGEYNKARQQMLAYPKTHGGRQYNGSWVSAPIKTVKQTMGQRLSQGHPGAAAIGAVNGATFGLPEAIAPDKMAMVRDAHPWTEMGGEIAGAIAGTKGLGMVGGRLAPGLAAKASPLVRNLATDTGYGTIRGGITSPDDPVAGALMGGGSALGGSFLGQSVGSLVGRAASGVTSSPAITRLRAQGVTPTIGQIMRGRAVANGGRSFVADAEDAIANTPGAGATVNTARMRSLEQANNAGYRAGGEGAPITGVGTEALDQLDAVKTGAYSDALDGVSLPANEPRFMQQYAAADQSGRLVDQARNRGDFGYIMDNQLAPTVGNSGQIRGRQLQDALRLIQGQGRAYRKAATGAAPDPMAAGVADSLGKVEDAFIGNAARNAPGVIPKLKKANRINRNLNVLDRAAEAASSDGGVWTGAQLGQAIKANNTNFGARGLRGMSKSPLYQLQQDMTAVLPNKVPPTGVNVAPWLAGAGLVGGAANEESGLNSNIVRGLSLAALLSTPYTKTGAAAIAKGLLDRPDKLRAFGTGVRKHKGLLGSALVPLMLEATK